MSLGGKLSRHHSSRPRGQQRCEDGCHTKAGWGVVCRSTGAVQSSRPRDVDSESRESQRHAFVPAVRAHMYPGEHITASQKPMAFVEATLTGAHAVASPSIVSTRPIFVNTRLLRTTNRRLWLVCQQCVRPSISVIRALRNMNAVLESGPFGIYDGGHTDLFRVPSKVCGASDRARSSQIFCSGIHISSVKLLYLCLFSSALWCWSHQL